MADYNKIKFELKRQAKFIYTKIEDLQARDPHRTNQQARNIAQCGITRCYVLIDTAEVLADENIITREEYNEIYKKCQEAHSKLIEINNELIKEG